MLGFIKKDFLYFRRNTRLFISMVGLYLVFGLTMNNAGAMSGMISMLGLIFVLNSFTSDEAAHWDEYALSLPVNRRDVVRARYLVGLSLMLICLALVMISVSILCSFNRSLVLSEELSISILTPILLLVISAVSMPLCYKYGVEKGRMAMMALMLLLFILLFGGLSLIQKSPSVLSKASFQSSGAELPLSFLLAAIGVSLLLYYISYRLSVNIYSRREF